MATDYNEFTVEELQDELRDRNLKVSGPKDELVDRLERFEDDGVEPQAEEEPADEPESTDEPEGEPEEAEEDKTPRGQRGVTQGYHAHYLRRDDAIRARAENVDGETELVLIGRVGSWVDQETDTKFVKGQPQAVDEDTAKRLLGETDSHGNPRFVFADS